MIHWNPETRRTTTGLAYGVDERGRFDFEEATHRIEEKALGAVDPLDDISMIHLRAERYHVLLSLKQREYNVYTTNTKNDSFSIGLSTKSKDFFRVGVELETGKATFAEIPSILEYPDLQTEEAKKIISLLPQDQLVSLGIECLRKIIK